MEQTIEFSMVCDRSIICKPLQYSPLCLHPFLSTAPKMHQNAVFQGFVGGFIHEFPFCGSFKSGKRGRKVWGNDATGGINSRDMGASGRSDR